MAISYVTGAQAASNSVILPAGIVAGDYIIVYLHRNAVTAPSLGTGYTSLTTGSANSNSFRLAFKIAAGTESGVSTPAFTNATEIVVMVYRGVSGVGGVSSNTFATSTSEAITGVATMARPDGTSWAVSFAGSNQITSMSTPTSTTLRQTAKASSSMSIGIDSNAGVTAWGSHTSTLGTTAVSSAASCELLAKPTIADNSHIVQKALLNTGAGTATTATFTLTSAPTAGNLLIAGIGFYTGKDPIVIGTGWTLIQNNEDDTTSGMFLVGKIAGAGESTTQSPGGITSADTLSGILYEISGTFNSVAQAVPQVINSHASTAVTTITTGSLTPTFNGMLALSFVNSDPATNTASDSTAVNSGWSLDAQIVPTFHRTYAASLNALTSGTTTAITNTFNYLQSSVQVAILALVRVDAPLIDYTPRVPFKDTFDTVQLAGRYDGGSYNPGTWTSVSGQLQGFQAAGDTLYHGLVSEPFTGFTNSMVTIQLVNAGNQALAGFELYPIQIYKNGDASNDVWWYVGGGSLNAYKKVAGTQTQVFTTTYSSTTHKYLRLKELNGNMLWDYSTDGATWINAHTEVDPFVMTGQMQLEITHGAWQAGASSSTPILDNLNILPNDTASATYLFFF